jgi:hypothetical protein
MGYTVDNSENPNAFTNSEVLDTEPQPPSWRTPLELNPDRRDIPVELYDERMT